MGLDSSLKDKQGFLGTVLGAEPHLGWKKKLLIVRTVDADADQHFENSKADFSKVDRSVVRGLEGVIFLVEKDEATGAEGVGKRLKTKNAGEEGAKR